MTTILNLLSTSRKILEKNGVEDADRSTEVLLGSALGVDRAYLFAHANDEVSKETLEKFFTALNYRKQFCPTAYLLGKKEFYSQDFFVNQDVLIPRPETEHIVDVAINILEKNEEEYPVVVDVGTGSGVIGLSIKRLYPKAKVTCLDISEKALVVARQNAEVQKMDVTFMQSDLLESFHQTPQLVVANLPYVREDEMEGLSKDIRKFEPPIALYGGKDGLDAIRSLIHQSWSYLDNYGALLLELGKGQASEVEKIMKKKGFRHVEFVFDLSGVPRGIQGIKE